MASDDERMPSLPSVEKDVLASCLSDSRWWVRIMQTVEDPVTLFWEIEHQHLATAMVNLHEAGTSIDVPRLVDEISRNQVAEKALGPEVRRTLTGMQVGASINSLDSLQKAVRDLEAYRSVRTSVNSIEGLLTKAKSGDAQPDQIASELRTLSGTGTVGRPIRRLGEVIDEIERERGLGVKFRVPSGMKALDAAIKGFEPGRLYVYGARPKVGKSLIMINNALEALTSGAVVVFVSLEMGETELWSKFLSAQTYVEQYQIQRWLDPEEEKPHSISDEDMRNVKKAVKELKEADMYLMTVPDVRSGFAGITASVLSVMSQYPEDTPVILFIDYLQLLANDHFNKQAEISSITRAAKLTAADLGIPIVMACQVNRSGDDGMPRPHHLKDSGSIEQDADMLMLMNRPAMQDDVEPEHLLEIQTTARYMPPRRVRLMYLPEMSVITDLEDWDTPGSGAIRKSEPEQVRPRGSGRRSRSGADEGSADDGRQDESAPEGRESHRAEREMRREARRSRRTDEGGSSRRRRPENS